jgi:hypothetical protein
VQRNISERGTDIAGVHRICAKRAQHVTDQRRGGRFAIGARDSDVAQRGHCAECNFHFADNRNGVFARCHDRCGRRWHTWTCHHQRCTGNAREVMHANLHRHTQRAQALGRHMQ